MTRKIIVLSVLVSQFIVSCSSSDDLNSNDLLSNNISELIIKPYSALTPDEQKVKLENEANGMLQQMEKSKTSSALEAIKNLENLLSLSSPEFQMAKSGNGLEDLLNISGIYGIYTWDSTRKIWIKTPSTTDLKFVFPAKKTATTNNATLSSSSIASNVKVSVMDTDEIGYWEYNQSTQEYNFIVTTAAIYDQIYLPSSVSAKLRIENTEVGSYIASAKYSGNNTTPTEASHKLTLNDGYVFENNGKRTSPVSANAAFSYNDSNIIEFNVGSTASIDKLIEGSELTQYLGKANCLISLMDNFVMVADMNLEEMANSENTIANIQTPDYNTPTYYTDSNNYNKNVSEAEVADFNKNVKMSLVSKKDGTKLADVIQKSEKGTGYYSNVKWDNGAWIYDATGGVFVQDYDNTLYLRFNDNTEVAMEVYFSSGFSNLETKFQDFIKSFNN